jgi:phosphate transport system permease protein
VAAFTTPATVGPPAAERSVRDQLTKGGIDWVGGVFKAFLIASLAFSVLILVVLIAEVVSTGAPVLLERFGDFMTGTLRTRADEAGLYQGLIGSFWICAFVVVLSFPLGIGAALYLEEYASDSAFSRFVNVNIRNLAGVPSIVYGILGFTIFTKALRTITSSGSANGRTVMSAGLTLAVLVLPIVIITASEAVRAVPNALREAGYGVGATRWEVIRGHVLPYAAPGIITGLILSLARALGEAAPLILVGATTGRLAGDPSLLDLGQLRERFTALPIVVTEWTKNPQEGFDEIAAAAIAVMLVIVVIANAGAILLRNHYEKKRA